MNLPLMTAHKTSFILLTLLLITANLPKISASRSGVRQPIIRSSTHRFTAPVIPSESPMVDTALLACHHAASVGSYSGDVRDCKDWIDGKVEVYRSSSKRHSESDGWIEEDGECDHGLKCMEDKDEEDGYGGERCEAISQKSEEDEEQDQDVLVTTRY
ncbi:hypothetical protein VTL71DRAFT_5397 [Oculimacula yallundae]|uniref:Uncharacterized protein n=1 Tax=Oculimacula yallundae TaxID=86028 RepID=A0ABR4C114_9HELO